MGRVEPAGRQGGRREDPRDERHPEGERRRPDDLALLLRQSRKAGPGLARTRTEMARDEATGEPRIRVWDAQTDTVVAELTPAELAGLANETGLTPGLLFETRT